MNNVLVTESIQFVADHYHSLPNFSEPRHGHNWQAEVTIRDTSSSTLNLILEAWLKKIDYSLLNDLLDLKGRNPTAEVLAEYLFHFLENYGLFPIKVRIREKPNFWASCSLQSGR
ncbi:MAG: 6-carboxytetrahydropterin synthase [Holophagaceae bacterium]|nr:6-carboxytetrahydropterin synthase [Holophagaceae bacterium]